MSVFWYFLFAVGLLFEFLLVWRIHKQQMWGRYPFFCTYVAYVTASTLFDFAVLRLYGFHSHVYSLVYWICELIAICLRFCIAWEIFRNSFPPGFGARRVMAMLSALAAALLTALLVLARWALGLPFTTGYIALDIERHASLVLCPVILLLLAGAHYYGIPLGRNIWGMAVGFGMFVSLTAWSFAALQVARFFDDLSPALQPVGFVLMLAIWTWALWRYAPNPPVPETLAERDFPLVLWQREWARLLSTLRKAFER